MRVTRRPAIAALTSLTLAVAAAVPATLPFAAETLSAQPLALALLPGGAVPTAARAIDAASLRLGAELPAMIADAFVAGGDLAPASAPQAAAGNSIDAETLCLAKAVRHEAGGSREGQQAVAQVIVNRVRSGRFADTVCDVVNQRGQFFRTADYNPDTSTPAWTTAVAVARATLTGASVNVAPGALFFHAAYAAPSGFFRTRERVASLGGNVFYR